MRLDHTDLDSIKRNTERVFDQLKLLRDGMHRCTSHECCGPLDVRLVANEDGELWFATGDVQYDTVHGAACDAAELMPTTDDEELRNTAEDLVRNVADQLAEQAA
jgi:hypothetical protein